MAQLSFQPVDKNNKQAILEMLINYKKQNPKKFELKKEEFKTRYKLTDKELDNL